MDTPSPFDQPDVVARYAEGPPRAVPGFHDLQRSTRLLLAEGAGPQARMLVLGAGGGLELKHFAEHQPGWRFLGIDPSLAMLDLARQTLGPLAARVDWHAGTIADAPQVRCEGACSLLTFHFIPPAQRLPTLQAVRARLAPGAPFVLAHLSVPQADAGERQRWLGRYAAFLVDSGLPATQAARAQAQVDAQLHILDPAQEATLLTEAGFRDVATFYQGLAFRGWVAYA
ncbi:class I SAM-dependent methyltransferase [Stenotrophomonas sp. 24(2023)]|uniref:class I SAM-dependent methyltransferase n=1 Tax=Stenotrophomonas sp. 24(2023) TaxID=3068324 RepID=UPI0027E1ACA9|nr:class I SAM-dependent methyltransferase [Stenotrophomonas sp. 24(2023)]WMJ69460.1 class I SAM-dependent methyltransferase [Stenotrophomonas sp. 24(2023)]